VSTTRLTVRLRAPRADVYAAVSEPERIARWRFPGDMSCEVRPEADGAFRVTLTYAAPDQQGKTTAHSDVYRARFTELVPGERVVEVDEFEADDPALTGAMTLTTTLRDDGDGTELAVVHEGVPDGVDPDLNEVGWRAALDRLAALVER
jgi:uncharacterized protein YndB with AHSA1/START domain